MYFLAFGIFVYHFSRVLDFIVFCEKGHSEVVLFLLLFLFFVDYQIRKQ